MPRFTLRQLAHFRAIAAHGSIARAAEHANVSRSALASSLDELERALRAQLFRRQKAHGVDLTPVGEALLDRAVSLLDAADDFEAHASSATLAGPLRVGCFASLAPTIVPTMLECFADQHPAVDLHVEVDSQDVLVRSLRRGDLDVAVLYNMHYDRSLATAALFDTTMHVILGAGHALAGEPVVALALLEHEPMILLDTPRSADDILGYFQHHGVVPTIRHRTRHFELVRSLVARGMGYSLFIQLPRNQYSYEGLPVLARPLDPRPHLERASVVWLRGRPLTRRAARFIDLAVEHREAFRPPSVYH